MGVTKTDFMRGMQCKKMLWLDSHHPELKIIPQEVQERLDRGNDFGDKAMGMFGPYVEVTTYKDNGRLDYTAMINKTTECLSNGTNVICEASFSFYGNYCAVDILRKTSTGYDVYEVKNSDSVKDQFVKDVGFQNYILRKSGVKVEKSYVVYNNGNEDNPFEIQEVTEDANKYSKIVDGNIWDLGKIKKEPDELNIPIGDQCEYPYRCWYYEYCHKN